MAKRRRWRWRRRFPFLVREEEEYVSPMDELHAWWENYWNEHKWP